MEQRRAQASLQLLIYSTVVLIAVAGFVSWAGALLTASSREYNKETAFEIAEAGIEYYRWHLAHAPNDFQDGTGHAGSYVHNFYDKDGDVIGTFTLDITPPSTSSTVVTVRSSGALLSDPTVSKVAQVSLAIPSLAQYAISSNDNLRFGTGTEVFGPVMSNGGIHFDGLAHNLISSAQQCYQDPDYGGSNQEFGVYTRVSPMDPSCPGTVPNRPDVFMAGRQFPVPATDYTGMDQSLSGLKTDAQNGGFYASSSGALGYDLELTTGGTYNLYKVTSLTSPPNGCTNMSNQQGWGSWSIQNETLIGSAAFPVNGTFFFEDNLWVRGQINHVRLTIASGKFPDNPSTWTNITVNSNLLYSNYDGTDALSLIAQNNVNVGLYSADTLRIDAALVAVNGRIGRFYYQPPNMQSHAQKCGPTVGRSSITLYGSMVSNVRYGFGYTDATGYDQRIIIYDPYLLYNPPPNFIVLGNQYVPEGWNELK